MFLKVILISICFKISYDQKRQNCDDLGLQIKVLLIFRLYQENCSTDLSYLNQFNLYVLLISAKELVMIKHFLSSHLKP